MPKQAQKISATDARNNFADIVNKVAYSGQEFLITRHDEIMARVVPAEAAPTEITTEPEPKETEATQETASAEEAEVVQDPAEEQQDEALQTIPGAGEEEQKTADQQQSQPQQPSQTQPESPPKPKRIELERIEAVEPVRPSGLRQSDSKSAEETKKMTDEEERLAKIKARILKIYKG